MLLPDKSYKFNMTSIWQFR